MYTGLDSFYFKKYRIKLIVKTPMPLRAFKGSAFRGGLGEAFKKVVCALRNTPCESCLLKNTCLFTQVFISLRNTNDKTLNTSHQPHPFVLTVQDGMHDLYQPGDVFFLDLLLIGKGEAYLPHFIFAITLMGQRGVGPKRAKFDVEEVLSTASGSDVLIYKNNEMIGSGERWTLSEKSIAGDLSVKGLVLRFKTPTKIKSGGQYVSKRIEFHYLIRALLRRLSSLSQLYCGIDADWNFKELIKMAEGVQLVETDCVWSDLFPRKNRSADGWMTIGGLVGAARYHGDITPFLEILLLGEYLGVGKNINFGCGRYEISEPKMNRQNSDPTVLLERSA